MANFTVSRLGAVNENTGSYALDNDLFLKIFSGEVLTSFQEKNVFLDKHYVRTISQGKSAQFPVVGKTRDAYYHTPGNEMLGGTVKHAERVITIDDLLVVDKAIASIDEAKNHYDVRGIYSREMGASLARTMDKHCAQVGLLAARSTSTITGTEGHGDGLVIPTDYTGAPASANYATNGSHLREAIFKAAEKLEEKDVPHEECYVFVRPSQYFRLVEDDKLLNRDYSNSPGDFARAMVPQVAGMQLVMTNHLPSANVTTGVVAGPDQGSGNKYAGDFSPTVALIMHPSAMGTLKLMDLAMEMEWDIRRQATFMVAKYAVGHGVLRPEGAVEIANATTSALTGTHGVSASVVLG